MRRKSIILLFITIFCVLINFTVVHVYAVSGVESKLNSLRTKFPDGAFWNHYGSNNPDGYTWTPCQTHNGNGSPDCNNFEGSIQCDGYARKIFYDIFGQYTRSLSRRTDNSNVQVGDYVRLNIGHSGVVLTKNGNYITLAEANVGNTSSTYCRIKWGSITYNINQISYFVHANNYDSINVAKPGKPYLNIQASDSNSNVVFSWNNSVNTHHYDLRIYKAGASEALFYKKDLMSKSFSYKLPAGNYYANVAAVGSDRNNYTFSDNISFTVKTAIPQPGKPTLKVTPGTGSYKTTFSWSKTSNTHYYALRIYKKSSDDVYKLISNIKNTNYSLILPAGEYRAVLNSSNSTYKTYTSSQSVNFSVMKTPTKSSDGWYYVDKLPSYVNSSQYTIQYKNITQKISKTSPGKSWVNKGLSKTQYENSGSPYWSKIELPTSNTRVLIGYNYYHYCGANTGVYVNYELGGNYQHEDSITNLSSVYVDKSGPDDDNPNYKYYILRWNNGNLAYCNSNSTCNGIYGTHGNRSYIWYRNSQYQNKVKVNYYKFVKESGWRSSKDSSATSIKVRYKLKNTTSVKRNVSTLTYSKIATQTYTGKQIKPSIVVKHGTKTLKNGTDYTLSYGTNKSSGKGTVKITGKGNYTGTITKTFTIAKRGVSKLTYSKISNKSYTGKQIKPSITVKYSGKTLKKGTDYTVSYGKNKSTGKGTVKITGKGNYTGSITKTFYIVPKKVTISSAKSSAKKKLTVKYKKVTGASGYQIAYSTSKSKGFKYITVNAKTAFKVIKKLKSKKNYFVKVRAYKSVGKKKYYGSYSNIKSVKVK